MFVYVFASPKPTIFTPNCHVKYSKNLGFGSQTLFLMHPQPQNTSVTLTDDVYDALGATKRSYAVSDVPGGTERSRNSNKDAISDAPEAAERSCDPHKHCFWCCWTLFLMLLEPQNAPKTPL